MAAGSDAPFGPTDPWTAIRTARTRAAASGAVVGADECVPAAVALRWYLADPRHLRRVRQLHVGAPADLVVLADTLDAVLGDPDPSAVRATVINGFPVHGP